MSKGILRLVDRGRWKTYVKDTHAARTKVKEFSLNQILYIIKNTCMHKIYAAVRLTLHAACNCQVNGRCQRINVAAYMVGRAEHDG